MPEHRSRVIKTFLPKQKMRKKTKSTETLKTFVKKHQILHSKCKLPNSPDTFSQVLIT